MVLVQTIFTLPVVRELGSDLDTLYVLQLIPAPSIRDPAVLLHTA